MCDTLYVRQNGVGWFAKNSDREPDEPQAVVWLPPAQDDPAQTVRATYLDIPQQPRRYGVLLSQPAWIWGGEIGVNTQGVAIGNEAVFSKRVERKGQSLLGMDLLRLGLERGGTAREALDVIVWHLERYGQGGPAGYRDKGFRYDNSFLIADASGAWVLETAGRMWAARAVQSWAISNCYSLGTEFDLCSKGLQDEARRLRLWNGQGDFDFAKTFETWLYPFVGGAHRRRALNCDAIAGGLVPGWASLAARLRDHGQRSDDFAAHDNRQVCMHAGSMLRPSQTTASLIARLAPHQEVRMAATGTSAPCLSLFEPLRVAEPTAGSQVIAPGSRVGDSAWAKFEPVHHRALFDTEFRQSLQVERDSLEKEFFQRIETSDSNAWEEIAQRAEQWRVSWLDKALQGNYRSSGLLGHWWNRVARRESASSDDCFV